MLAKTRVQASDTAELRQAAGNWLRQMREIRGISQRELAKVLDLEYYTFVSQLEHGRGRIPSSRYREWAVALGVDERVFAKRLLMYYDPVTYEMLFASASEDEVI